MAIRPKAQIDRRWEEMLAGGVGANAITVLLLREPTK
jgi:hypothetical protein